LKRSVFGRIISHNRQPVGRCIISSPLIAIGIDVDWPLPHHYDVIRGIIQEGEKNNWRCHVVTCLETSKSIDTLPDKYDGIIARFSPALADYCEANKIPAVNVWSGTTATNVTTLGLDHREMGRQTAHFLLQRGFHNYGFVGRPEDAAAVRMRGAMETTINEHNCESRSLHVHIPYELDDWLVGRDSCVRWLDDLPLPAAVLASDPIVARTFVDYCQWRGILIPDDVAVVSFRDSDLVCAGITPELTAVAPDYEALGKEAAVLLSQLLEGASPLPRERTFRSGMQIVERRSTDAQPVNDRLVARALRFIRDNSQHAIYVPDVAKTVGMSQRNLERRFRAALDMTINQALVDCRLRRAKRLLSGSDLPIKVIANEVGFGSNVRMAQVFAKRFGQTPRAYRREHQ
jgi:LacI family transcriptional regulator